MRRLTVELANRGYDILIGRNLLSQPRLIADCLRTPRTALVSNTTVSALYRDTLESGLRSLGIEVTPVILPDGEAYKTGNR